MPIPVPVDYGVDVQCWSGSGLPDLDPYFTLITGNRLLMEACLRRLFTERGTDQNDPNYGYYILNFLNARTDSRQFPIIEAQIAAEVIKDERIAGSRCKITAVGKVLKIRLSITPASGPTFEFTLGVDHTTDPVTFSLLFPGVY